MGDISEQPPNKRRRILLRLDDGSLIGESAGFLGYATSGVALLDYEQACRLGRAGEKEVKRLTQLIKEYAQRHPADHNLKPSILKPYNPYTQDGLRALRRQKSLANGDANHVASPESNHAVPSDFMSKCWDVLSKTYACIGPREVMYGLAAKDVFYKTVAESFPALSDQYYQIITNPITFKEMEDRLKSSSYSQPQQFADDARLLFNNCRKYNTDLTNPVRKLGERMSDAFEQAWAASGLCHDSRAKRATAGVAAPKFEPDDDQAQQQHPARTKSHSRGGAPPPRNGQQPMDGVGRTWSHEVSSYQDDMAGVVEQQQEADQEALVAIVADAISNLEDPESALALFNEGVVNPTPEGEVELDFGKVTMEALIQVDNHIRELQGLPPRQGPVNPATPAAVAVPAAAAAAPPAAAAPSSGRPSRGGARVVQSDSDFEEDDSESDDED